MQQKQLGNKKGISAIEILIVVSIIVVALTALLGLVSFSLKSSNLIKHTVQANALAQETMEAVRNLRDQTSWDNDGLGTFAVNTAYHPEKTSTVPPEWTLLSGEEIIGIFSRKVVFGKIFRDANDDIADSGTEDTNTKIATTTVSWEKRGGTHQVEIVSYFTNWQQ